jgi:glycosyltransferase involved in cell wall biosynthesis
MNLLIIALKRIQSTPITYENAMIKFSILISTIPRRLNNFFPCLTSKLMTQIEDRPDVEILGFFDNKKRTVGQKRNELLRMAQGEYLTFIDDDDDIADDYISSIMETLTAHPEADCVVFDCICTINGDVHSQTYSKYSIQYEYNQTPTISPNPLNPSWTIGNQWTGKPAHTMVYKSTIAKNHIYANQNYGEDVDWVVRACKEIKNEIRIDKILYFYNFNTAISETRG